MESYHQMIKAIVERDHISPLEAVFKYNMSLRLGQVEEFVSCRVMFIYVWQHLSKLLECFVEESLSSRK